MRQTCTLAAFLLLASFASAAFDPDAFVAAVALYNQHKPAAAQQAFEVLAAANPANADIQFYLGRLALQRNDHEKAVVYLEKAVELSPNDSRFQQRLGDAYGVSAQKAGLFSQMGLAKKCKAAYERAVELDPKNLEARLSLLGYYQQAPSIVGGGLDKAMLQAQEIKKLDPARGRIAVATLLVAGKKFDEAFAEFDAALQEKPDDYSALFQTGRLAAISGQRLDRGLELLRQCLTMTPPEGQPPLAAAHWRIGNILEKKGDKPGARAAYEASLKADPKFAYAVESLKKLN
jgi:tetratricopeptide (TPR) repeat protein